MLGYKESQISINGRGSIFPDVKVLFPSKVSDRDVFRLPIKMTDSFGREIMSLKQGRRASQAVINLAAQFGVLNDEEKDKCLVFGVALARSLYKADGIPLKLAIIDDFREAKFLPIEVRALQKRAKVRFKNCF